MLVVVRVLTELVPRSAPGPEPKARSHRGDKREDSAEDVIKAPRPSGLVWRRHKLADRKGSEENRGRQPEKWPYAEAERETRSSLT